MPLNLKTCPDCGYDLSAVSAPGRCPACEFEFDEQTRVWRSSRSWQHHFIYNALVGLIVGIAVTVVHRIAQGVAPNPLLPIVTGVVVALAGLAFDRVLAGKLSGRFVALAPTGVVVGTRRHRRLVTWHEIHRLKTSGRVPKLELTGDQADIPLEDVFDTPADLEDFRIALSRSRP